MTLKNLQKAPFPWFGGKSKAAPLVWELLGDVPHYCEPFAGSLAVLLNRPHKANTGWAETVNDLDGLIVNAWRAIQWHPEETAEHASWPVSELDKMARELAVVRWREENLVAKLGGVC
jgi:site-specific DNA-adenine methylase